MKLPFVLFIGLACLGACQSTTQKDTQTKATPEAATSASPVEVPKNFMVITSWATTDRQKAIAHIPLQQKQLMSLWDKGIVETIYYDQKGKFNDDQNQPLGLIAFVIKGLSEEQVRQTLDTTDVVRNNLANYTLHQVGQRGFGRSDAAMKVAASAGHVYAVMWAFLETRAKADTAVLSAQAKVAKKLQREGILENGYMDSRSLEANAEGIQPAAFFMNARSEEAARKLLDAMPIVTSKQATYALRDVGGFMAGTKN